MNSIAKFLIATEHQYNMFISKIFRVDII